MATAKEVELLILKGLGAIITAVAPTKDQPLQAAVTAVAEALIKAQGGTLSVPDAAAIVDGLLNTFGTDDAMGRAYAESILPDPPKP